MREGNLVSDVSESIKKELTDLSEQSPLAYNKEGLDRIMSALDKHLFPRYEIIGEVHLDKKTQKIEMTVSIPVYEFSALVKA